MPRTSLARRAFFAVATGTALAGLPELVRAQHQVTAALVATDPQGEFDLNTDTGFGFTGSYLYGFGRERVFALGVTGTVQSYGRTSRRAILSPTIPDIRVDVETTNNNAYLQGVAQLKAPTGAIQPYGVATGGL
ncbi:MAG TPA: hypothetical protein VG799_05190, partial [Gemmatimonadota bacterium]|nr:hypothetical protein [Gemmatimonadota bacterium]